MEEKNLRSNVPFYQDVEFHLIERSICSNVLFDMMFSGKV